MGKGSSFIGWRGAAARTFPLGADVVPSGAEPHAVAQMPSPIHACRQRMGSRAAHPAEARGPQRSARVMTAFKAESGADWAALYATPTASNSPGAYHFARPFTSLEPASLDQPGELFARSMLSM